MDAIDIATDLCRRWESCKLEAYPDPISGGDPWTIGYGSTGPDIKEGTVWTQQQASDSLSNRLHLMHEAIYGRLMHDLSDHEMGACLSLSYNIGINAFLGSTLLHLINQLQMDEAADEFLVWNKSCGKVIQGLINRRKDERRVFLGGDP